MMLHQSRQELCNEKDSYEFNAGNTCTLPSAASQKTCVRVQEDLLQNPVAQDLSLSRAANQTGSSSAPAERGMFSTNSMQSTRQLQTAVEERLPLAAEQQRVYYIGNYSSSRCYPATSLQIPSPDQMPENSKLMTHKQLAQSHETQLSSSKAATVRPSLNTSGNHLQSPSVVLPWQTIPAAGAQRYIVKCPNAQIRFLLANNNLIVSPSQLVTSTPGTPETNSGRAEIHQRLENNSRLSSQRSCAETPSLSRSPMTLQVQSASSSMPTQLQTNKVTASPMLLYSQSMTPSIPVRLLSTRSTAPSTPLHLESAAQLQYTPAVRASCPSGASGLPLSARKPTYQPVQPLSNTPVPRHQAPVFNETTSYNYTQTKLPLHVVQDYQSTTVNSVRDMVKCEPANNSEFTFQHGHDYTSAYEQSDPSNTTSRYVLPASNNTICYERQGSSNTSGCEQQGSNIICYEQQGSNNTTAYDLNSTTSYGNQTCNNAIVYRQQTPSNMTSYREPAPKNVRAFQQPASDNTTEYPQPQLVLRLTTAYQLPAPSITTAYRQLTPSDTTAYRLQVSNNTSYQEQVPTNTIVYLPRGSGSAIQEGSKVMIQHNPSDQPCSDVPRSSQFTSDVPRSSQFTSDLPRSSQFTSDVPRSSQFTATSTYHPFNDLSAAHNSNRSNTVNCIKATGYRKFKKEMIASGYELGNQTTGSNFVANQMIASRYLPANWITPTSCEQRDSLQQHSIQVMLYF